MTIPGTRWEKIVSEKLKKICTLMNFHLQKVILLFLNERYFVEFLLFVFKLFKKKEKMAPAYRGKLKKKGDLGWCQSQALKDYTLPRYLFLFSCLSLDLNVRELVRMFAMMVAVVWTTDILASRFERRRRAKKSMTSSFSLHLFLFIFFSSSFSLHPLPLFLGKKENRKSKEAEDGAKTL